MIVLATGFDAHAYMRPMELVGEDGVTLEEAWRDGPRAYRTVAIPRFPNLFMLIGPHSPVGNHSLISIAETQAGYVMRWIQMWREGRIATMAPGGRADPAIQRGDAARRCRTPSGRPAARAGTSARTASRRSGPGRRAVTVSCCRRRRSTSSRCGPRGAEVPTPGPPADGEPAAADSRRRRAARDGQRAAPVAGHAAARRSAGSPPGSPSSWPHTWLRCRPRRPPSSSSSAGSTRRSAGSASAAWRSPTRSRSR